MIHSINLITFLHGAELQSGDSSRTPALFHFAYSIETSYLLQEEVVDLGSEK